MWSNLLSVILLINELMAANVGETMSPATNFDSWIELYNPTDESVSLGGMILSDNKGNSWTIPSEAGVVAAGGFKVVWLGSNGINPSQAPFKLDCDGGTISISDASGQEVDSKEYPSAMSRTSYARTTDGGSTWSWAVTATPGTTNTASTFAEERLAAPEVSTDSRLFTGQLAVSVDIPDGATLMYTTDGSVPKAPKNTGEASPWTEWVRNGNCEGSDASCLISRDADGNGDVERIVDGAGVNGSRGIKIHAVNNPTNSWDAQLFVYTPDHVWQVGEKFRFKMMVKADKATYITVQSHSTPHNYISGNMLDGRYNVGIDWAEIDYEGTVTADMVGGGGGGWWWGGEPESTLQTIAFNLNEEKKENNFYFDEVSWASATEDVVETSKESKDGRFSVSGTSTYCFRLFKDGYLPSVPVYRSYIQSGPTQLPVISIVGDKRYFTDPKWGIDTQGTNGRTGNGRQDKCNWNMDWERPVNFSYIGTDGSLLFTQDVEIEVSGGWTRAASPRSFKLKSGKEFDGQNRFDYAFFPQKPYLRNKVLLIRNGGNDVWDNGGSRFMDPATQTILQRSGINLDLQSYVPVIEYVNGEYRGMLNMREPNNKKFVEANWGYDDKAIDMFEMSADSNLCFMVGTADVLDHIYELGANVSDANAYAELKTLLDIDEFINYMAVELFLGSTDWPHNNIKGYRSQEDGRYRFVTFDLDFAFRSSNPFKDFQNNQTWKFNLIYDTGEQRTEEIKLVTLFLNMLNNDEFRKQFIDTYCIIAGSVFDHDRCVAIVDELVNRVSGVHNVSQSANKIKNELSNRMSNMISCMQKFSPMQLSGVQKMNVSLNSDTKGATILVNGIEVPYTEFSGYLFAPIHLECKAPTGYRFTGWKSGSTMVSTKSAFDLTSGSTLVATFEPLTETERAKEGYSPVRINEVSADNNIFVNEYWKRNDWIELYNATGEAIDVDGMYLSNNLQEPHLCKISGGETVIPPYGYLMVWCDGLMSSDKPHTTFKLSAKGGDVILTAADDSWSDQLTYTRHQGNESVGRFPDGNDAVYKMNVPTPEQHNLSSNYLTVINQPSNHDAGIPTNILPADIQTRYVLGRLVVCAQQGSNLEVAVVNMAGQNVASYKFRMATNRAEISLEHLPAGVYVATTTDDSNKKTYCKFVKK